MLWRTKYSRLRNDSLGPLEERPQRILTLKGDLCVDSDFALLEPGAPDLRQGPSPRGFAPLTGIPAPQSCPRGQASGDQAAHGRPRAHGTDWDRRPPPGGVSALSGTKRPIALHRMTSLPSKLGCPCSQHAEGGLCCLETAAGDLTTLPTPAGAVHHDIKYLGNVEVTKSMRTLDSDTRIQLMREAISRLCERTSVKAAVKMKRPGPRHLTAVLGGTNLQFSGVRVILSVSTDSLTLIAASSLQKVTRHPMQTISFASGGDPEMADYIAYVAKDIFNLRACHILECPRGRAGEVISSISWAFESRFHRLRSHTPALFPPNTRSVVRMCHKRPPEDTNLDQATKLQGEGGHSSDYYNLVPGRTSPARLEHQQPSEDKARLYVCDRKVPLYENCLTGGTSAPPADSGECHVVAEELIQDQGWFQGRLGQQGPEAMLPVRESSSAAGQYTLSGLEGGTARCHREGLVSAGVGHCM